MDAPLRKKGRKSRGIPVRHDLEGWIFEYLDAAGLRDARKDAPLFQSALKKRRSLTGRAIHVNDICRMMKRRLKDFGLSLLYSPHSFGVTTLTDLFEQGVHREDVQHLAGHAMACPYNRRRRDAGATIIRGEEHREGRRLKM
jgi:integrase/recombinase XerD